MTRRASRVEAAVLGTGSWARQAHLPGLGAMVDVELVGCVDSSLDCAAAAAQSFRSSASYRTLTELLGARPHLGLLVIAAPDDVHAEAMQTALFRGVPVFCEKPLANDATTAAALAELVETSGVAATVGFSFRYSPAVQALRADLCSGQLGEIWFVELAEHNAQFHPVIGKGMNWKGDPSRVAAGALLEYGSHVLDLCLWLFGPVATVGSNLVQVLPDARLDDIATLQFRLACGASGTMMCSWLLTGGYPGIKVRLHTSRGLAQVELSGDLPGGERYARYNSDGSIWPTQPLRALTPSNGRYTRLHLLEFVSQIRHARAPSSTLPTVRQATDTQRLLNAALKATHNWVTVEPTPNCKNPE